jgi:hypothetical protein
VLWSQKPNTKTAISLSTCTTTVMGVRVRLAQKSNWRVVHTTICLQVLSRPLSVGLLSCPVALPPPFHYPARLPQPQPRIEHQGAMFDVPPSASYECGVRWVWCSPAGNWIHSVVRCNQSVARAGSEIYVRGRCTQVPVSKVGDGRCGAGGTGRRKDSLVFYVRTQSSQWRGTDLML